MFQYYKHPVADFSSVCNSVASYTIGCKRRRVHDISLRNLRLQFSQDISQDVSAKRSHAEAP